MMKLSKLSLLTVLFCLPFTMAFADGIDLFQISGDVVFQNINKFCATDQQRRDAAAYYSSEAATTIEMATREARQNNAIQSTFENSYDTILRTTCQKCGFGANSKECTNFVTSIIADAKKTTFSLPGLCLDGSGQNAVLADGTRIKSQGLNFGTDPCYFLDSSLIGSDQYIISQIHNHIINHVNRVGAATRCDPNLIGVRFSDMTGDLRVARCYLNNAPDPTYFVIGNVTSRRTPSPATNQNNFNPDTDTCPALKPYPFVWFVQGWYPLRKEYEASCAQTIEYFKRECQRYKDSTKDCIYNRPITGRRWQTEDQGDQYMLHCQVDYDNSRTCDVTAQSNNTVNTASRRVGAACNSSDLPTNATQGVYITGGVAKWDCTTNSGQPVKCSCAARECAQGYMIATNNSGASLGYCQAIPQRIQASEIATLPSRTAGPITLPNQDSGLALHQPTSQGPTPAIATVQNPANTANDRCTLTHGRFDSTTNSCLCNADLHMISMTSSSGLSYCVCDYQNGYVASRDGKSCELTESARRKQERQQRQQDRQNQQQPTPTNQSQGTGNGSADFTNPLDNKLFLGTESLTAFK